MFKTYLIAVFSLLCIFVAVQAGVLEDEGQSHNHLNELTGQVEIKSAGVLATQGGIPSSRESQPGGGRQSVQGERVEKLE